MADILPSEEIAPKLIDATQSAVIEAVDSVSELISETTQATEFVPHPQEQFYKTPEFWVGFAFLLVVVFLAKPVGKAVKKLLIKRKDGIVDQINQAEKLRDDAQLLLAQYERKFLHAEDDVGEIIEKTQREIKHSQQEELEKLESNLNIRRKDVENAIDASIEKARKEINLTAGTISIQLAKNYIEQSFGHQEQSKLIDDGLERILNHLKKTPL